ncbi:Gp37-like protein [Pseudokineococcus lusitanus]|nr:hypothetical protein [Pseudokineococcus lusitanus]
MTVWVYNRVGRRLGSVGAPRLVSGTLRDGVEPSTVRLEVDLDDRLAAELQAPGARVEVHREDPALDEQYLSGGWMKATEPTSGPDSALGVDIEDYEVVLRDLLAWPVPAAALAAQNREQWRMTGFLEDIAKALIRQNVARSTRRVPIFVAPSLGRGRRTTVVARMEGVDEVLLVPLEQADLRVVVRPAGPPEHRTGLLVDVVPRTVYPKRLTEAAGIVITSAGRVEAPEATRVVAGGGGEGVARDFRSLVDPDREAAWAREIERFVDARDARSELDEANRELEQAQEAEQRANTAYGEARNEQRHEEGAKYAGVQAADVALVRAEAARDRLPSTATAEQKQAAADVVTEKTEDLAAARKDYSDTVTEQTSRVREAIRERDVAAAETRRAASAAAALVAPYEADLLARMRDRLAEGAPKASVSVALSETATFAYGKAGLVIGARVTLGLARGVDDVVERLRSVEWAWAPGAALTLTPQIGERPPDLEDRFVSSIRHVARVVGAVAAAVRQQQSRR